MNDPPRPNLSEAGPTRAKPMLTLVECRREWTGVEPIKA
jgi:hypothetical protein